MQKITKEDLLNSGAHFGHVSSKTNPNFKDFVVSQKNGIDIINLDDTLQGLDTVSYTHLTLPTILRV